MKCFYKSWLKMEMKTSWEKRVSFEMPESIKYDIGKDQQTWPYHLEYP